MWLQQHQQMQLGQYTHAVAREANLRAVPEPRKRGPRARNSGGVQAQVSRRNLLVSAPLLGTAPTLLLPPNPSLAAEEADRPSMRKQTMGFADNVSEFTLENGLHFIVLERHKAPTVGCHLYANVGAFDESDGRTGLAHLMEHMAFKGTRRVGGKDWKREGPLLDAQDEVFYSLRDAKDEYAATGSAAAKSEVKRLEEQLGKLQDAADALVVPNAYGARLQRAGAIGLNASTTQDQTRNFCSLPSNKLELWFAMEAERFRAPVFRGLYAEKKVIAEERRLRVKDAPLGRFQQEFARRALANNYRRPIIGEPSEFERLGRVEVAEFALRNYGPDNLTIAVVGDVTPDQVWQLAQKYWGGWQTPFSQRTTASAPEQRQLGLQQELAQLRGVPPSLSSPPLLTLPLAAGAQYSSINGSGGLPGLRPGVTPVGTSAQGLEPLPRPAGWEGLGPEQRVYKDAASAGPLTMMAFYRPPMATREGTFLEVACELLSGSRTSRLVSNLVLPQRIVSAGAFAGYPGAKHAGLAVVTGVPNEGDSVEKCQKLLSEQVYQLAESAPSQVELGRVQADQRMSLLGTVLNNSAMASLLTSYHVLTGSWRGLLDELELVGSATPEDVRAVAESTMNPDNVFAGLCNRK